MRLIEIGEVSNGTLKTRNWRDFGSFHPSTINRSSFAVSVTSWHYKKRHIYSSAVQFHE